jgi:hypothetical protein
MSYKPNTTTIAKLMEGIDDYYLPAIQREFVWPTSKIENLFDSLLREYPIGTLLLWEIEDPAIHKEFAFYGLIRDFDVRKPHNAAVGLENKRRITAVLDGQQRITALLIGLLGSHREKLPRKRWDNPDAFPERRLYVNLLYRPGTEAADQKYQVRFLTQEQARATNGEYWLRVGQILSLRTKQSLRDFRRSTPHGDDPLFEDNLEVLWSAIHERENISFFLEARKELDEVLEIFVRLNTGGTPLSYSDLLLSLLTASWGSRNARDEVYKLADYLNADCGRRFAFTKDFILKALLVLNDKDVRFKTENIRKGLGLEALWESAKVAMKTAVKLISHFGLDEHTLTAPNAVIPVVYYLSKCGLDESFLTRGEYKENREAIRTWILKALLGRVFRGHTDEVLRTIREATQRALQDGGGRQDFPAEQINEKLRATRALIITRDDVASLVEKTSYGEPYAFGTLALAFPYLTFQHSHFHVDHMHPKAAFNRHSLEQLGMTRDDIEFAIAHRDSLPNLQLLTEAENERKGDRPLRDWLDSTPGAQNYRATGLIPEVELSIANFRGFYEARRTALVDELARRLGALEVTELGDENGYNGAALGDESRQEPYDRPGPLPGT